MEQLAIQLFPVNNFILQQHNYPVDNKTTGKGQLASQRLVKRLINFIVVFWIARLLGAWRAMDVRHSAEKRG